MASVGAQNLEDEPRWHGRLGLAIVIVGTLIAMGRCCFNDFTWWDDAGTVHQNQWLLPPTYHTLIHYWTQAANGLYIPVTYTVWAAVASIAHVDPDAFGIALNPWLFHTTNVCCHLLGVLVAYRILRLLDIDACGACCGALLFGVHPIQVEAVAWVSGLKDVLSGMFALIALWQYVCFARSDVQGETSRWRYLLATIAFTLAMLAKPSAMALPLAAMALDRWCVGRSWRKIWPGMLVWGVLALPLAAVARKVQDASNTPMPPFWLRPLIVFDSLAFYVWKLVWPLHLTMDYGRNPTNVLAHGWGYWDWIIPVSIGIFLIAAARRRPVLLAAGMIFIAGCLPVLGFTPAMFQFMSTTADHYLYLSMFGPALALAWILSMRPSIVLRVSTSAVLAILVVLTIRQSGYWQNDITLFQHDVEMNPNSFVGYMAMGNAYDRQHDTAKEINAFRAATIAGPDYAMAWDDLGLALMRNGDVEQAIAPTQRAVDLQIKYPHLRLNWRQDNEVLGRMLYDTGRFKRAIPYLQTAAELQPMNQEIAKDLEQARKRAATQPSD